MAEALVKASIRVMVLAKPYRSHRGLLPHQVCEALPQLRKPYGFMEGEGFDRGPGPNKTVGVLEVVAAHVGLQSH